jgi:GDP-4-dehydro-6-deoxy-D-mannose reductase
VRTGNPDSARDFSDVRDVVRAYALAAELEGGAFNVCSGSATSVAELVATISAQAKVAVRHEVDPARLRADDAPLLYGSHDRLTVACGWRPEIGLERTIADTLEWWRGKLAA